MATVRDKAENVKLNNLINKSQKMAETISCEKSLKHASSLIHTNNQYPY